MAQIRVQNLQKSFGDFTAVKDSSFTVNDGEFFCLLGPSGCGKTTTLRMIAGLELPTSGNIFLGSQNVTYERASKRDIAFVFQMFALYPHMTVRQNIAFPLVSQGLPKEIINQKVIAAAKTLQISNFLDGSVSGLSSGDRQRVALGRAIVREPAAFMMDEPLGALDAEFRELMCEELRGLHDRLNATTVYVTHDQREAMSMADKIAIMNKGEIEQIGTPRQIYESPATMFVADFMGSPSMNFVPIHSVQNGIKPQAIIGDAMFELPALVQTLPDSPLTFGIRPEHIQLTDQGGLRAEVLGIEYLGNHQIVTLKTILGGLVRVKVAVQTLVNRGDHVGLQFDTSKATIFETSSGKALQSVVQGVPHG
jgi:multiple sugar transport system ATP-binding protein